jgi:hypothetical protein
VSGARRRRLGLLELDLVANVRPKVRAAELAAIVIDVLRHADVIENLEDERVIAQVCEAVLLHAIREARMTFMPMRKRIDEDSDDDE